MASRGQDLAHSALPFSRLPKVRIEKRIEDQHSVVGVQPHGTGQHTTSTISSISRSECSYTSAGRAHTFAAFRSPWTVTLSDARQRPFKPMCAH